MKTKYAVPAACFLWLLAGALVPAGAAPADNLQKQFLAKIDELMPGMGAPRIEDRKDSQIAFERICFENSSPAKAKERAALCAAMMERVGPDVALPARVWLLRKVETIGRDEVVARLTELLKDPDIQIREPARRALANNPSLKAAASLRDELNKATDSGWRVTMINALAWRKDREAVPAIAKLASDQDPAVAAAAICGLGRIADDYSVETLAYLRKKAPAEQAKAVTDASFMAAEALVAGGASKRAADIYEEIFAAASTEPTRLTAMQGITAAKGADAVPELLKLVAGKDERMQLAAARCLQSIPGEKVTRKLVDALKGASPDVQAVLAEMLGKRGDAKAGKDVAALMTSPDAGVRIAAAAALRYIGNGKNVEALALFAAKASGDEREAARESLKWMKGKDVDDAVLKLAGSATGETRSELVRAAAVRLMKPALGLLLANTHDADESVRIPVIYNIGKLAKPADLPKVVAAFAKLEGRSRDTAQEAISRIASHLGEGDEQAKALVGVLASADASVQPIILGALAGLRSQPALDAIRAAAKSNDPQIKAAAAKALAEWGPEYCMQWVFAGPFAKGGAGHTALFDEAFPPEDPQASVQWKTFKVGRKDRGPDLDLLQIGKGENCCAYLKTKVISAKDQDVVLMLGSDDGVKVWLNGKVVHANNATRGFKADEDQVPVQLKQGENTLLIKVTQGGAQWTVSCGMKSPAGGPPDSLKFEAK